MHQMKYHQRAGLCCIGRTTYGAGIERVPYEAEWRLYIERDGNHTLLGHIPASEKSVLYLRLTVDDRTNTHQFSYSQDGLNYHPLGESFSEGNADWKGYRLGLFTYTTQEIGGTAYFTNFQYHFDGPGHWK